MKGALRISQTLQTQVPLSKQFDYRTPQLIQTVDSELVNLNTRLG